MHHPSSLAITTPTFPHYLFSVFFSFHFPSPHLPLDFLSSLVNPPSPPRFSLIPSSSHSFSSHFFLPPPPPPHLHLLSSFPYYLPILTSCSPSAPSLWSVWQTFPGNISSMGSVPNFCPLALISYANIHQQMVLFR